MSIHSEPNPSNPEPQGPVDRLEPLTPDGQLTLRTIQEIVMKQGVDIVDSPTAMEDLKPHLGEPGYFFDVLNDFTPPELGEGDVIGRGYYRSEAIKAPDGSTIELDTRILIPIGPRPDIRGRRILANCWVDITSYPSRYLGVVMRYYSTKGRTGSVPLVETQLDLNYAVTSSRERQIAIEEFENIRPTIEPVLENLGLLTALVDRFEKFKQTNLSARDYVELEFIKQDEIDLGKFAEALKGVAESE